MEQTQKKKLDVFVQAIMEESAGDVQAVTEEMERKQTEALARARSELEAEAKRYKAAQTSEIHARERGRVNARMTENRQNLLQYRESCAREAYAEVRSKLEDFTKSEAYGPHLKKLLNAALGKLGQGYTAHVYLAPQDMRFAEELSAAAQNVSLVFQEGHFQLGGLQLICQSRGLRIDMCFDTTMNDVVGRFAELSGMPLT